jgi:hypothetical protein
VLSAVMKGFHVIGAKRRNEDLTEVMKMRKLMSLKETLSKTCSTLEFHLTKLQTAHSDVLRTIQHLRN